MQVRIPIPQVPGRLHHRDHTGPKRLIILFIVVAAGVGLTIGGLLGAETRQLKSLMLEFACRNTALTILVGMTALGRPEFAVFGLVVFLTQMPIMLGVIALAKKSRNPMAS